MCVRANKVMCVTFLDLEPCVKVRVVLGHGLNGVNGVELGGCGY